MLLLHHAPTGSTGWIQTSILLLNREVHYQLCYRGIGVGGGARIHVSWASTMRYTVSATPTLFILERIVRIELTSSAWKADILPLYHTRLEPNQRIELWSTNYQSVALPLS